MGKNIRKKEFTVYREQRVLKALQIFTLNNTAKSMKAIETIYMKRRKKNGCPVAIAAALTAKYLCKHVDPAQRRRLLEYIGPKIERHATNETQRRLVRNILYRARFVGSS